MSNENARWTRRRAKGRGMVRTVVTDENRAALNGAQLKTCGVNPQCISFTNLTMESEKYVCARESGTTNNVVIVEVNNPLQPMKKPITADSALMNPTQNVIALKARVENENGVEDSLQIFNIDQKAKIKGHDMEPVVFWKWITPKMLGIVTNTAVFHWSIDDANAPVKVFDRTANLNGNQIISYKASEDMQWFTLIGIAQGDASRPALVKGNMQLYSVAQQRSQPLEAHMAAFTTHQVPGNAQKSQLVCFAQKMVQADGSVVSKLHVIELGAPAGQTPFTKRTSELFSRPSLPTTSRSSCK